MQFISIARSFGIFSSRHDENILDLSLYTLCILVDASEVASAQSGSASHESAMSTPPPSRSPFALRCHVHK